MKFDKEKIIYILPMIVLAVIIGCIVVVGVSGKRSFFSYAAQIKTYSTANDLNPALVAALIKAESGFDKNAKSDEGAVGLMQLMPETAEFIADKVGYKGKINLKSPDCNICLGTEYLAYLSEKFEDETTMLCAYNAGEGRVNLWLNDEKYSSDGVTLCYIPFAETRKYVERINKYRSEFERYYFGK